MRALPIPPSSRFALILAVLTACGTHNEQPASGDGAAPDPFAALLRASVVDVGTGDLDGDGSPEIAFTPEVSTGTRTMALSGEMERGGGVFQMSSQALTPAPRGTVVFTHDASGNLVLASDLSRFDFGLLHRVASLQTATFAPELNAIGAAAQSGGCNTVDRIIDLAASMANKLLGPGANAMILALLGAPNPLLPTVGPPAQDEDFTNCVTMTPQTPSGCFLIQLVLLLENRCLANPNPACDLVKRRTHCYQVPPSGIAPPAMTMCASPPATSSLCDKTSDTTGCCNLDFIYNSLLFSDIRNQAPNPIQPAFGPFVLNSTAILGGPTFEQLGSLVNQVIGRLGGTASCGLSAVTRNPVDIIAKPLASDCIRNSTKPGHILQGYVDQCLTEDPIGVYTSIVGSADYAARLGGLNELVGPAILGTVRDYFQRSVTGILTQVSNNNMCCNGNQLLGGLLTVDSSGNVTAMPSPTPDPSCAQRDGGSDAGVGGQGGESTDAEAGSDQPPAPPLTVGTAVGDPHLRTFDGERYDCQPWGEETLCISRSGDLEVQIRTHQLGAENVSVITAVAARVGSDRVAFYLDGRTTEDGAPTTFPQGAASPLPGGGTIWHTGNSFTIVWPSPDNSQLKVSINGFYVSVKVNIADARKGQISGLLGNANTDAGDDIMTRDEKTILSSPASFNEFYKTYVQSWRIAADASMFEYPDGESTQSPDITNLNFPRLLETFDTLDAGQVEAGAGICQAAGITSASGWLNSCVLDVELSSNQQAAGAFLDVPPVYTSFDLQSACAGCAAAESCCGGACTLTTLDSANCGGCGNACTESGATCAKSTCGCNPPRSTHCIPDAGGPSACVDLTSDGKNCGKCGNVCSGSMPVCSSGTCMAACNTASGQTLCGTQCVTLGDDPNNCGVCGNTCATSEVCSGGLCASLSGISAIGCADGTREVFTSQTTFPAIAACAGGWDGNGGKAGYTGVFPAPLHSQNPHCTQNGNDGPNPSGAGCSAIDLCAPGWHICAGGEIIARVSASFDSGTQTDGCTAATWPASSFFASAIGSTGYSQCAEPYGTVTGPNCNNMSGAAGCQSNPGLTNDIFGCGTEGASVNTCGDVDRASGNLCGNLDRGWNCGNDPVRESVNVVHTPNPDAGTNGGGVLCCVGR
jgi:hypothetical protein